MAFPISFLFVFVLWSERFVLVFNPLLMDSLILSHFGPSVDVWGLPTVGG